MVSIVDLAYPLELSALPNRTLSLIEHRIFFEFFLTKLSIRGQSSLERKTEVIEWILEDGGGLYSRYEEVNSSL